jgi:tRNA1(Val) A37 N6-methylase TrmN6
MLTKAEQRRAAKEFSSFWKDKGYEKGESQSFWLSLLRNVFGIQKPEEFISFENRIKLEQTSFIDGYIPKTKVLIEQKGINVDLRKGIKQSDGSVISPYQQARRYANELRYSERARWIVTCNFKEFHIYDMEKMNNEPEIVLLSDLENDFYRLFFLVKEENVDIKKQTEVSIQAGELVGLLYDALLKQYQDPNDEETLKHLNILCVRLVFCFYAEDSGLFGKHNMFHDYLAKFQRAGFRNALSRLFKVLDQKPEDRDPYLDDDLAAFPYVNGGLFEKEDVVIPFINSEIIDIILNKASADFNWNMISPTIFGAVFESTLNPESRRAGGMHYTSIENIHKVIDPLFLDALHEEFEKINNIKVEHTRKIALSAFQTKLASLKFLDPAAGSGNFLTQTYLSLRRLENKVIESLSGSQMFIGEIANPIRVSISQFYGIEINDFAVTVARTALWIAESQMMSETENLIHANLNFLPLTSNANIVEGNALRMDWNEVIPSAELDYIMGNPPFVGKKEQTNFQKADMRAVFGNKLSGLGKLDYVTAWYKKTMDYIKGYPIITAYVSTNSITQGEQVPVLWPVLLESGLSVSFAYHSFVWNSQSSDTAHVHCVIIGFSSIPLKRDKVIYLNETQSRKADNINPYLVDAPNIIVKSKAKPIAGLPQMVYGSMPIDDGNLILDRNSRETLIQENPDNLQFIRPYIGGNEIINNELRWCIWLKDINPTKFRKSNFIMDRIKKTYEFRRKSSRTQTKNLADTPMLFGEIRQPEIKMLAIPKVSSEKRRYVPIVFVEPDNIVNGSTLIVPSADFFLFGLLTSNVHMGWLKSVGGRMEMRYQYSATIVYNTFPWPDPTASQKTKIETTAQTILDARALYPEASLADLYDDLTMPVALRKAHQDNDRAVMEAYGFNWRTMTEAECVAELMKMYQKMTQAEKGLS